MILGKLIASQKHPFGLFGLFCIVTMVLDIQNLF